LETTQAFQALKKALMTAPVLSLADFELQFEVETDAFSHGTGVVLQQRDIHSLS